MTRPVRGGQTRHGERRISNDAERLLLQAPVRKLALQRSGLDQSRIVQCRVRLFPAAEPCLTATPAISVEPIGHADVRTVVCTEYQIRDWCLPDRRAVQQPV